VKEHNATGSVVCVPPRKICLELGGDDFVALCVALLADESFAVRGGNFEIEIRRRPSYWNKPRYTAGEIAKTFRTEAEAREG
jgi:hypothetical protein